MSADPQADGGENQSADIVSSDIVAMVRASVLLLRSPHPALEAHLQTFAAALLDANHRINLVSRKDTHAHLARFTRECLFLASLLQADVAARGESIRLLDIGSGGGFPGLVIKLALPQVETVLVEGTQKKAKFLAEVCERLDLRGIKVIWARAEALSERGSPYHRPEMRHDFDWVTVKALGPIRDCVDLAAPFLRDGGVLWMFKGPGYEVELASARRRMTQLCCELHRVERIPGGPESYLLSLRRQPNRGPNPPTVDAEE